MQSPNDPRPTSDRAEKQTGDPVRLRALVDSAVLEAEACGKLMIAADLSAIADRIVEPADDPEDA